MASVHAAEHAEGKGGTFTQYTKLASARNSVRLSVEYMCLYNINPYIKIH